MERRRTIGRNARILLLCTAAMLAANCAAANVERRDPEHRLAVALPSPVQFSRTDTYAREVYYFADATYHTVFRNTTGKVDTFRMDIENEIVPEGLGMFDWLAQYCDTGGACHFGPWDYVLQPGEAETFDVHLQDNVGTTQGMALTTLTATWGRESTSVSFATFVDLPSVLLLDDDGGASHETYLAEAVEDAGYWARPWDADEMGRPGLEQLESYRMTLWSTADGFATYIDEAEEQKMMDYLDGGGNLMLSSMDYLSSRAGTNTFISDYLRVSSWTDDVGAGFAVGVTSDPIADGMSLSLSGGPFSPDNTDEMTVASPAEWIFSDYTVPIGLRVEENDHRIVFLAFPIEAVGDTAPDPDNRATLVGRVIDWLDDSPFAEPPSGRGVEQVAVSAAPALEQNAPNPFNPNTEIAFTVPENAGLVTLSVHDVSGRLVRTLLRGELPPGRAKAAWNGTDASGSPVASGIYLARLRVGDATAHRKMMLIK